MLVLYVAALAAELSGLLLAARGFRRTWQDFRAPTDEFWHPIFTPLTTRLRAVYTFFRGLFGKQQRPTPKHVDVTEHLSFTDSASSSMTWGPFPSVEEDPAAFTDLLQRRMSELFDRLQRTEAALQRARQDSARMHREAATSIDQVREEARGQVRTITIGGLRDQVIGWMLIVSGVIAAGLGDIINAW